jgi:phosphoglucosamine mutase
MTRMFGTDGIRGKANAGHITAETLTKIGMAVGSLGGADGRMRVVIGKDTRLSGYMIESALTSGLVSVGADPILVGPLPTPAIAMLTRSLRADFGIMITASHNPYHDNGIKIFDKEGAKICDTLQNKIEAMVNGTTPISLVDAHDFGRASRLDDAQGRYIEHAKNTLERNIRFDGMRIVLDCANGSGYRVAPTIFRELGAEVIMIGCDPDGCNINDRVGATHTQTMRARVLEEGADLGIALDGDADRVIISDEDGVLIDGDQILAMLAERWCQKGKLLQCGIVSTSMSNLGLEKFLKNLGLLLHRTGVGDRAVAKKMRSGGYNLGGEQSGHIILGDYSTTGDGIATALQVLQVIKESSRPASIACRKFIPAPQILKNVAISRPEVLECDRVQLAIKEAEQNLTNVGRLLVRPSGTEPLIRIMGEGEDRDMIRKVVEKVANTIAEAA